MTTADELILTARKSKGVLRKARDSKSPPTVKRFKELKPHELNALTLLSLEQPLELCWLLKTPFYDLEDLINEPVYKTFSLRKKNGGSREICAPSKQLRTIQKQLNYFLQAYYLMIKPAAVHGFVVNPHYRGTYCNIAANAQMHTGKKHVLNIDLKDFFPSIHASRVRSLFLSEYFQFSESLATALTLLVTYQAKLPIGAPTSPVISNFICLKLDDDLVGFSEATGLTYSRYADDLTFSSDIPIANDTVLDIINIITNNGFVINERKLRLKSFYRKQTVTGLTVNEKVNVGRKLLKKIRAMLHDMITNGVDAATRRHFKLTGEIEATHRAKFIHRLEGYINFVGQVRGKEDALYVRQKLKFDQVFKG